MVGCPRCNGTGRAGRVSRSDLLRLERGVEQLRHRLRIEPPSVMADFPAEWPYVVHVYHKTGSADVTIQVTHPTAASVVYSDRIRKANVHEDATIANPNPALGLGADPLVLPDDTSVRNALLDQLIPEATARLLSGVVGARIEELEANSETLSRQGRNAEAIEALVDLARTLEGASPEEAARIISQLKDSQRTHK